MSTATIPSRIEAADVKAAAKGRTVDILVDVAGIPRELLDGKPHPCPKCQDGVDRFRLVDAQAGAVRCNQCFAKECGDFIAAIQWMAGQAFPMAVRSAAEYLGMSNGNGQTSEPVDVMTAFCRQKHISPDSLKAYGAETARRGNGDVVRIPMFDQAGEVVGHQDYGIAGALAKGLTVKGEKAGLFIPGRLPESGETVVMGEGCKDSSALHELGFFAIGTPGTVFRTAWARAFRDCRVVLIPDRDKASYKHFDRVGNLLAGVASSVGRVDLPFEMAESGGKDTRDLLQQPDGETMLRELIDEALAAAETEEAEGACHRWNYQRHGDRPR